MPSFTPTQQLIMDLLSDGEPHKRAELLNAIDPLCTPNTLQTHLSNIRKVIRPSGEDVVCELRERGIWYRRVRLLASAYDGKR